MYNGFVDNCVTPYEKISIRGRYLVYEKTQLSNVPVYSCLKAAFGGNPNLVTLFGER